MIMILNQKGLIALIVGMALVVVISNIAVGYPINDWLTCLLYTSPSPRDRTRSRMPSSA